jgi:hypothetical protein
MGSAIRGNPAAKALAGTAPSRTFALLADFRFLDLAFTIDKNPAWQAALPSLAESCRLLYSQLYGARGA